MDESKIVARLVRLSAKRYVVTDMGSSAKLKSESGETLTLPRYGVWDSSGRKPEVIDTSADLKKLLDKYGLTEKDVVKMASNRRKIASELIREAAGAENGIWEAIDEISGLSKNLNSHLKNFGLRQDQMAKKAMKSLGDSSSFLRELI